MIASSMTLIVSMLLFPVGAEGGRLIGDMNCDGSLNSLDIDPFVMALADPDAYEAAYPECDILNADINGDGSINSLDTDPFVALLAGSPTCDDGILNQGEERIDCGGPCPPCECLSDGECDDFLFCTGTESCDAYGNCQPGDDPCPGQLCDEDLDQCVECLDNGDCEDGLFCNGDETCDPNGICQDGTYPCTDPNFPYCDEPNDLCIAAPPSFMKRN